MFSVEMSDADAQGLQASFVDDILSFGMFVLFRVLSSHVS